MLNSKLEEDNVPEESLTVSLPDASKGKGGGVVDSVSPESAPSPTVGDFPDGGLTAWLVVVGVCAMLTTPIHHANIDRRSYRVRSLYFPRQFGIIFSFALSISDVEW